MVKPTNFDEMYPGRYLKAGLLKGKQVTVTISDIHLEELEGEKGIEQKAILSMAGKDKQLVLCKLNGLCVKAMFGTSLSAWIGKKITLYPTAEIAPMKKGEECIRIFGSPDIEKDMAIQIQLPRRKPFMVNLRKVVQGVQQPTVSEPLPPELEL